MLNAFILKNLLVVSWLHLEYPRIHLSLAKKLRRFSNLMFQIPLPQVVANWNHKRLNLYKP